LIAEHRGTCRIKGCRIKELPVDRRGHRTMAGLEVDIAGPL
jgi:hypothetical protein